MQKLREKLEKNELSPESGQLADTVITTSNRIFSDQLLTKLGFTTADMDLDTKLKLAESFKIRAHINSEDRKIFENLELYRQVRVTSV